MGAERKIAIATDSGSSMRPEFSEVKKLGITIAPLQVVFFENGQYVQYSDLDLTPDQFYEKMRASSKPPLTVGRVPGTFMETFGKLARETDSIISINVTSKHSGVYQSAMDAKDDLKEEFPNVEIGVIDSQQISLGEWFLVKFAKELLKQGVKYDEIISLVNEERSKIHMNIVLETLENVRLGGRANEIVNQILKIASVFPIKPILGLKEGKLVLVGQERTTNLARKRMIEMVGDAGPLEEVAVVHTNAPVLAEQIRVSLSKIFTKEIPVREAGPVLGVHAGPGGVGVVWKKA